ncbi:MAG: RNA methyltransferase [Polyangiaceae bacterium]|nr:RNA methyltransferase [Polyangiaceae bacterium]
MMASMTKGHRSAAVALVHYPVLDRQGRTVMTSVTNLDIHDIARSLFTYGIERFYVVHPNSAQRALVERIVGHWTQGSGGDRIPDRVEPLSTVRVVESLDEVLAVEGLSCEVWATTAQEHPNAISHADAKDALKKQENNVLLCFGTGWGLAPEVMSRAKHVLAPIRSPRADGYNHLSVRAAVSIFCDRFWGPSGG